MTKRKSPFTKSQMQAVMQAAKAEGFERAELSSPDGHRAVFERRSKSPDEFVNSSGGAGSMQTEELDM
jgi:hypothetical protein